MKIEMLTLILLCLSIAARETLSLNDNIYEWAQRSGEYSKWIKQVDKSDENYKLFLQNSVLRVTAFIPTDEAFRKFSEPSYDIIGFHLVYGSLDLDTLLQIKIKNPISVKRSKLRFSRGFDGSSNRSAVFVLDARILESQQVGNSMVNIIDRVLDLPKSRESFAPNALELIKNPNIYPSVSVASGVGTFSDFIERQNVTFQFSNCTECTFFVPENIDSETAAKIDANVLLGHIIPNQILFLRSMNNSTPYKTKADLSNLTVELYKEERSESDSMQSLIYFNTKDSISTHFGNTRVKITRANIPVNNGVIHIIEKPLLITDVSILNYLDKESEANEAHESVNVPQGDAKLHFIENKLVNFENDNIEETTSFAPIKGSNFSVDELHIEGDGVKGSIVKSEGGCINIFRPFFDVVPAIPNVTIKDVLHFDPAFKTTFAVAEKIGSGWLNELGNKNVCYTFFAPSEVAWKKLFDENPSAYKVIVDGLNPEGSKDLLERFLVIDGVFSLDFLSQFEIVDTINTQMVIQTKITEGKKQLTLVHAYNRSSTIVRPDIFTNNGYIHEIDTIFMAYIDLMPELKGSAQN
ncbi:fasciclin-1-like [Tetranychus urticae]|uniref:FAS1 domain-containing protein n=1 Tax=Tetranychus urticae TaxID=32264 RepID=T1KTC8_TETUR|nr:fasciclin-1-like [Tetranychus urticae]